MTLQRIFLPHLAVSHLKKTWGWYRGLQGPLSRAFHIPTPESPGGLEGWQSTDS